MPSQADKLRAIILNITVIANTLNRPLFQLTKLLMEAHLGSSDSDSTVDLELYRKADELRKSICGFKNLCDRKY